MQTIEAISVGNLAVNLQKSVGAIERAATRLRLEPVLVLDHVRHYSESQAEQIREQLQRAKR